MDISIVAMQITLLKILDICLGPPACFLLKTHNHSLPVTIGSILIIRPGGIGDAVLLLPVVRQLSALYPGAKIDILAEYRNAEVFSWSPHVNVVWRYDHPKHLLRTMRSRYDLVIDTEQWYRLSAVITRLINPHRSIGFATNERLRLFTDPCPYDLTCYETNNFLSQLHPLGYRPDYSQGDTDEALRLPRSPHLEGPPYVILFPGGSAAAKRWPIERYTQLAHQLEQQGLRIIILGGKDDREAGKMIATALRNGLNVAGETSLTEAAAIVAGAQLMISGDSGLMHVAQLLGVPTVTLFGPSDAAKWSRHDATHQVLQGACPYAPCARFGTIPRCDYAYACMKKIEIQDVMTAVSFVLGTDIKTKRLTD